MDVVRKRIADSLDRRSFIGGSDARIIMGDDEAALLRLWREKRGEIEPEDLSGDLLVQLGSVTEPLNRHWYEKNTEQVGPDVGIPSHAHRVRLPGLRRRTPLPPPFSSINWIPPFSNAARIFCTVASRPPSSPSTDSKRAIVGSETPDADARSDWDQPNSARPAFICLTETTAP